MINSLLFQPPNPPNYSSHQIDLYFADSGTNDKVACLFLNWGYPVTLLFSHGNAEDIGSCLIWVEELARKLHCNLLLYDYFGAFLCEVNAFCLIFIVSPGYGLSTSENMTEKGIYASALAAYNSLRTQFNIPANQIILYGRSLGTAPTTYLAAELCKKGEPPRGVILQSALLSVWRIAFEFRFTMRIFGDSFSNIDMISKVTCPTLIVHGVSLFCSFSCLCFRVHFAELLSFADQECKMKWCHSIVCVFVPNLLIFLFVFCCIVRWSGAEQASVELRASSVAA